MVKKDLEKGIREFKKKYLGEGESIYVEVAKKYFPKEKIEIIETFKKMFYGDDHEC